jgi:sulfur-oxidizing protein SoxB
MKHKTQTFTAYRTLLSVALAIGTISSPALADNDDIITLIEMGDLHGTLVPHAAIMKNPDGSEYEAASSGGLARLKTVVNTIPADNPEAVLLSTGDLTHGSAETMFTVGDAMMIPMNAFGIDVYTPGNWDFGYGAAVFRNRFTSFGPKPTIPGNIRTMSGYISCDDVPVITGLTDEASGYTCYENLVTAPFTTPEGKGVIKANFPTVAANLYNAAPLPVPLHGKPVLPAYQMLDRNGTKIAVIGITASIVPQQADAFNITFRFTQGVDELPGLIKKVKEEEGAELIVVQSELGLPQNIKIAQSFEDIDVMYSAHTHEVTLGALLADKEGVIRTTPGEPLSGQEKSRLARGAAIVVETNRDMYVGRLDLHVAGDKVINFDWQAIPVDESVAEDPAMAQLVAAMEDGFVGDGLIRHTFMPGGFLNPAVKGLQLVDDLDTVVGYTDSETLLLRHHVLEDTLNNFIADGILAVADNVADVRSVPGWENGVDISMANGFRFGNAVLPDSAITLRDLYTWFPIAPAVNVADFSGSPSRTA